MGKYVKINNEKGSTLIEMLLYIAISSVIVFIIVYFLITLIQSQVRHYVISEVEQQGAFISNILTATIENAEAITSPTPGNVDTSLTLNMADVLVDPTVFSLSGSVLQISEAGNPAVALSNSRIQVSNVQFSNLSRPNTAGTVRVQYDITHINPGNIPLYNYTQTFFASATLYP